MKHRAKAVMASLQVGQQELGSMVATIHSEVRTNSNPVLAEELSTLEAAYSGVSKATESLKHFIRMENENGY